MKNDYVQASLRHSRFLFVYSAKHATELERMRKRGCALRSGVIHAKHVTFFFAVCALYLTVYEILMFMGLICVIMLGVIKY